MPFTRFMAKTGTIGRMAEKSGRIIRGEGRGLVCLFSMGCAVSGRIGSIGRMFARFRVRARAICGVTALSGYENRKDVLTRRLKISSLCSLSSLKGYKLLKLLKGLSCCLMTLSSLKSDLSSLCSLTVQT